MVIGEPLIKGPIRERGIVIVAIVLEQHVRKLQPAAVLHWRALWLALRVEPFGVGEAVVLAPARTRLGVDVKDSVDDAADIAGHPEGAERGRVWNRAAIVRANVE